MAVNARRCPWWLTWAFFGALVAVFVGERPLGDTGVWRAVFSGAGFGFAVIATAWRAWAWLGSRGDRRRIHGILLAGYAGSVAALVLYFLGSDLIAPEPSRLWSATRAAWPILLACSLLPALAAQWAIGSPRAAVSSDFDEARVEALRVVELAVSALDVAVVASFLFLAVFIAKERDTKWDVSYFKTSAPGSATVNMVSSLDDKLQVLLWFPPVNEVKDEVEGYFTALAAKTGKVEIQLKDRMVDPALAKKYRVSKDGIVTLVKGDQHRNITLDDDIARARAKLRELDGEVQKAFMKIARAARTVYFTVGHGELNDPNARPKGVRDPFSQVRAIRDLMTMLNYRVKDLGLRQGLAQDVPDDAALVMILGPTVPFMDAELDALDRYLAKGGAVFMALEPNTEVQLGPLAHRLGIELNSAPLADDRQFVVKDRSPADRLNIVTDQFSSHASITSLSRARAGSGILLLGAASLDEADWGDAWTAEKPKRTFVVKSLASTFRDENRNYQFDADSEKRAAYNLMAAIEGPKPADDNNSGDGEGDQKDATKRDDQPRRMRAFVVTDVHLLSDGVLAQIQLNRNLVLDALKWVSGDEEWSGEVESEKDVPIQHTKDKDVVWFYTTIAGAPLLVLGAGLLGVRRLRRRRRKQS